MSELLQKYHIEKLAFYVPGYSPWPCRWSCLASFSTARHSWHRDEEALELRHFTEPLSRWRLLQCLIHSFLTHRPMEDARWMTWLQHRRASVNVVYHIDSFFFFFFKASDEQQLVITVLWGEMLWIKLNILHAEANALELPQNPTPQYFISCIRHSL